MPQFDFGRGPVNCRRHNLGNGLVASTAHVSGSVSLSADSAVGDGAFVEGNVSLMGSSVIKDSAVVKGERIRLDNCVVTDSCHIGPNTSLTRVRVSGAAYLKDIVINDVGNRPVVDIDETPVVITGIGVYPAIIIPSPEPLLLFAYGHVWSILHHEETTRKLQKITSFENAETIMKIAFQIMRLRKGWALGIAGVPLAR